MVVSLCFIFRGYKCFTIYLVRMNSKLGGGLTEQRNEPNFHLHNTVLDMAISSLASLKLVSLCVSLMFILLSNFFPCIIHTQLTYLYPREQKKHGGHGSSQNAFTSNDLFSIHVFAICYFDATHSVSILYGF